MTTVTGKRVILKNLQDEYLIPFTDQGGSGNPDNETIILNDEDALRAIKVMDQGQEEPYAFREVTAQEYEAMKQAGTLDPHTYYNVPDVDDIIVDVNSKANKSLDNLDQAGQAIINGKANISLDNLDADGEARFTEKVSISACVEIYPVIQTYQNGTSWYRIYSDGWCEQGGRATGGSRVKLLKAYADANYSVLTSHIGSNAYACGYPSDSTSQILVYCSASGGAVQWQTCGYIDMSD